MSFLRLVIIFLAFSYLGKGCSLSQFEYCKFGSAKKYVLKPVKNVLEDSNEKNNKFKRKYKVRGVQVFASTVSILSFACYSKHSSYSFPQSDLVYRLLEDKLHPLRGPPVA